MCVVWGMFHWLIYNTRFLEQSISNKHKCESNQSFIFAFSRLIDLFSLLLAKILIIRVLFALFLLDSRRGYSCFLLPLLQPTLEHIFMCLSKAFSPEILRLIRMLMHWHIAIEMHEVPFDRNYTFLCLNISSSWHSLALELASSSMAGNVVVELAVIGYLDP